MFVKMNDGKIKNVTNESDVAEIIEEYCGDGSTELADYIRNCEYFDIKDMYEALSDILFKVYDMLSGDLENKVELSIDILKQSYMI